MPTPYQWGLRPRGIPAADAARQMFAGACASSTALRGKPKPSVHTAGAPLEDHLVLSPIVPEDEFGGVFDTDRLPQEAAHLGLGHPELRLWPSLSGCAV